MCELFFITTTAVKLIPATRISQKSSLDPKSIMDEFPKSMLRYEVLNCTDIMWYFHPHGYFTMNEANSPMALTKPHRGTADSVSWSSLRHWHAMIRDTALSSSNSKSNTHNSTTHLKDDVTFEAFFRRYEPRISGYLWRMLTNADEVSDLCQETFFRAWQQFGTISTYPQPASWLFRVATNLAINHMNRRKPVSLEELFDPASSDPANHVIEREMVRQTMLALPPKARAIIVLRDVYTLSYREIGDLLSMSPDAVKMALSRAREQFRKHYTRKEGEK